jgi:hypothetical protein
MEPNRIDIADLLKTIRDLENQELNANAEQRYKEALHEGTQEDIREAAMSWIMVMDGKNFQDRLFGGTMPDFERETEKELTPEEKYMQIVPRSTAHPSRRLTEQELAADLSSQGHIHRKDLRYISLQDFIENCYHEFQLEE